VGFRRNYSRPLGGCRAPIPRPETRSYEANTVAGLFTTHNEFIILRKRSLG
jgi:hypothetical protein